MGLAESPHDFTGPVLTDGCKRLPRNGRRVHTSTLWRWCRKGCHGVELHYVALAGVGVTETGRITFLQS